MKKGLNMTRADAEAHQKKHGFGIEQFVAKGQTAQKAVDALGVKLQPWQKAMLNTIEGWPKVPKPRQNKTEQAFGLILEAMKRRGDLIDYKPFGIRLEWGAHPQTGRPMIYSPDFTVLVQRALSGVIEYDEQEQAKPNWLRVKLIEVKGAHIWEQAKIRFRGCRAEWGLWFQFEMHQKKGGVWTRIE